MLLLEQNRPIMLKVGYAFARSSADRDDLIANMTAALWSSFGRYDDRLKFSTWMYRVVLNVAISFSRRDRKQREHDANIDSQTLARASAAAEIDPNLERLLEFIATLPELDRALMLLYLDDLTCEQISEVLGLSATNVATKLSRIRARAKTTLAPDAANTHGEAR